ncbi:MAG: flavodoxin [Clostridia bacterium]
MIGFKKKMLAAAAAMALILSLSACGASDSGGGGGETVSVPTDSDKILIAYFTAAENSGVDAVASASVTDIDGSAVGLTRAVADMIQDETGGELFSIRTSEVYPANRDELIDYAAQEQEEDARPELTSHIDDLDQYDVIFVGYPNWWADLPMAVYSFFDEYDFSGKTIIPFNVHNGSQFSGTIETIQELEPDADVIENGFTVSEQGGACLSVSDKSAAAAYECTRDGRAGQKKMEDGKRRI